MLIYVDLLEKYNTIWKNVSNSIKKEFDREPLYNTKHLKTKIKSYEAKKSTQILTMLKYQNKVLNLFFYC